MKLRMLLTTTVLALAPALPAIAACSGHERQVMSCAQGSQYDEAKGECVVISS